MLILGTGTVYSQTTTIINYQTYNASGCNIFANGVNVPVTINGTNGIISHITTIGQPTYDSTYHSIELNAVTESSNSVIKGTEYKVSVSFKQHYTYKITINAARKKVSSSDIDPNLRIDLNNVASGGNNQCNGTETIDPNLSGNFKQSFQVKTDPTNFADNVLFYNSLSAAELNLAIAAIPGNNSGLETILIRKITVEETPPPASFTITPQSVELACGSTNPLTFTINGTNVPVGATPTYNWFLGNVPNGWLYNGNEASQNISTGTTNTITLTPVSGVTPKNITATVSIGSTNYHTDTSIISIIQPSVITGDSIFCSISDTFRIPNLPASATVSWSAIPSQIVQINSPDASQTTLTRETDGIITLTAIITASVCGAIPPITRQIVVGKPVISGGTYSYNGYPSPGQTTTKTLVPFINNAWNTVCNQFRAVTDLQISDTSNVTWSDITQNPPLPLGYTWNQTGNNLSLAFIYSGRQAVLQIVASNTCGVAQPVQYGFWSYDCNGGGGGGCNHYNISPNPASSFISITPSIIVPCASNLLGTSPMESGDYSIRSVRITDENGITKVQRQFGINTKNVRLNISTLRHGTYFVEISNGSYKESQKMIIE